LSAFDSGCGEVVGAGDEFGFAPFDELVLDEVAALEVAELLEPEVDDVVGVGESWPLPLTAPWPLPLPTPPLPPPSWLDPAGAA
jgi:hypothetical protein